MLLTPSAQSAWSIRIARLAGILLLAGCAVPPEKPLSSEALSTEIESRSLDPDRLAEALQLADIAPLALPRPSVSEGARDKDEPAAWHAAAWAFGEGPRRARRDVFTARAKVTGAGLPGPIGVGVETADIGGEEAETEVAVTVDLLGLLGVGRSAAAKDLANAELRSKIFELEEALWGSRFEVDRARAEIGVWMATDAALEELLYEAQSDWRRLEILHTHGRLSEKNFAAAKATRTMIEMEKADIFHEIEHARTELAKTTGLSSNHPALQSITKRTLQTLQVSAEPKEARPSSRELAENHPEIRALRLQYAVAEAEVRAAASEAWPEIRIGPRPVFTPDALLSGGVLDVELPFPGTADAAIAVALSEREGAREAVESALVALEARVVSASAQHRIDAVAFLHRAPELDAATKASWRAARAAFGADPEMLEAWTMEFERRFEALMSIGRYHLLALQSQLDYEEASGPRRSTP